jgi:hypothetical protein
MKDKEIIERKLEILLDEHKIAVARMKRLEPIIKTYATRYFDLTGKNYTAVQIDRTYTRLKQRLGEE